MPEPPARVDLTRYAWLAIVAALVTIALKAGAWWLTGSVGLLSDAAESVVNLVAAVVALYVLVVSARPPDETHPFGHTKAEYFSAMVEGTLIFVAAVAIIWSAIERLLQPRPLENVGVGLMISVVASLLNGAVAMVLLRAGRRHRSLTLTADGRHLMTDVITSAGVVAGVLLVWLTGWQRLDPVVAILVGLNIIWTGWRLVRSSVDGLMDHAWPDEENHELAGTLDRFRSGDVDYHGLRTRLAGRRRYATAHLLVPGAWTVARSHDLAEEIEQAVRERMPDVHLVLHVEPREDPRAYDDYPVELAARPVERGGSPSAGPAAVEPADPSRP